MTREERIRHTLAQPLFINRNGEALSRPQFLARAVMPKPVTLQPTPYDREVCHD